MRKTLLLVLVGGSVGGCGPIVQNPVELAPYAYAPGYHGSRLALKWVVETRESGPEKTSTSLMPAGPVFIPMGGYDVPVEQLLTEIEQRNIAALLANTILDRSVDPLCEATFSFEELDYQFHQHQYWATVELKVSQGGQELFSERRRLWSAENMSFGQRMNAYPQTGKQALAQQILDHFAEVVSAGLERDLNRCVN